MKQKTYSCWIDKNLKILSFHPVANYERHDFFTQLDLMDYAYKIIESGGYRVQ